MNILSPGITSPRRVVITGIGIISVCGSGKDNFWQGLHGPAAQAAELSVPDFDATPFFDPKAIRRVDRVSQFAVAAAEMALNDGGRPTIDPDRAGVWVGTGIGGMHTLEEQIEVRIERGPRRVSPFLVPMLMANAPSANLSMRFGWRGPCENTVTACAAGTQSVGNAARLIASGRCDVMLTGASEATLTPTTIAGFRNMTALSTSGHSRPFDKDRDGFVIAEGVCVLLMESLEHAQERGAHIYGEVLGAASTADAHHITAPNPDGSGAVTCIELALSDAELDAGAITQINAHGTSTGLNDSAEAAAIAKVFGPSTPVTSIKGVTGHALGAAGAIEAASVLLSFEHREIPPTAGYETPDPEMAAIDIVTEAREWVPGPTISNSFGFGGHNGCVIFAPMN